MIINPPSNSNPVDNNRIKPSDSLALAASEKIAPVNQEVALPPYDRRKNKNRRHNKKTRHTGQEELLTNKIDKRQMHNRRNINLMDDSHHNDKGDDIAHIDETV